MPVPKKFGADVRIEPLEAGVPKKFGAEAKVEPVSQQSQGQPSAQARPKDWASPQHTGEPGIHPSDWLRGAAAGLAGLLNPETYKAQIQQLTETLPAYRLSHGVPIPVPNVAGTRHQLEQAEQQVEFAAKNPGYTAASVIAPGLVTHGITKAAGIPKAVAKGTLRSVTKTRPVDVAEMVREQSERNATETEKAAAATEKAKTAAETARAKQAEKRSIDLRKHFEKMQEARGETPTSLESGRPRTPAENVSRKEAIQKGLRREDTEIRTELTKTRDKEHAGANKEYQDLKTVAGEAQADPEFLPNAIENASEKLPAFRSDPVVMKDVERFLQGGTPPTFNDLQSLRSRLGNELATKKLPGETFKVYSDLQDQIDGEMQNIITRTDPSKADALSHAQNRWRKMKETFYDPNSILGKFIQAEKGQKFNPEESFGPLRQSEGAIRDLAQYDPKLAQRLNRVRHLYGETRGISRGPAPKPSPVLPPKPSEIPIPAPVEAKTTMLSPETLSRMKGEQVYRGGRAAEGANAPAETAARGAGGVAATVLGHPILGTAAVLQALRGMRTGSAAAFLRSPRVIEALTKVIPADLRAIDRLRPADRAALTANFTELARVAQQQGIRISPILASYLGLQAGGATAEDQSGRVVNAFTPPTPVAAPDTQRQIQDLQNQIIKLQNEQENQQ
jgi:hypothetical protein